MAKKAMGPKEAQLKELGKGKAPAAFSLDTGAMMAEITAIREKYTAGAKEQLAALQAERTILDSKIGEIENLLASVSGRAVPTVGKGKGTRRSGEQKEADIKAATDKILAALNDTDWLKSGQLVKAIGTVDKTDYGAAIANLLETKKIMKEGMKAGTSYKLK